MNLKSGLAPSACLLRCSDMNVQAIRTSSLAWLRATETIYRQAFDELDKLCVAEARGTRTDPTIRPLMIAASELLRFHAELQRRLQSSR